MLNLLNIRHSKGPKLTKIAKRQGWHVLPDFHPKNFLTYSFEEFEEVVRPADFIFGAPPCHTFSTSGMWNHWKGYKPLTQEAEDSLRMAVNMARYLTQLPDTKVWVMENPQGALKKNLKRYFPEFVEGIRTTYCVYGQFRMKPTYFWPSFDLQLRDPCKIGQVCHQKTPNSSQLGTRSLEGEERAALPIELQYSLLNQAENHLRIHNNWRKMGDGPKS